jgi:hypothetical protein
MYTLKISLAILFIILISSCNHSNSKSPELIEANEMHLESMRIHENIESQIIEQKKQATKKEDFSKVKKLDSLSVILELWEAGIVEVPGFEHEHHHGKGEHQEHKAELKMTDESMLEYQKNSKQAIEELQKEISDQF